MDFAYLFTKFIEQASISPTELAIKMGVSPGYIFNLKSGRARPPTISRLEQITNILSLSKKETEDLLEAAATIRIPEKEKMLLKKPFSIKTNISPEILEILQDPKILEMLKDPIARNVGLITHKSSQDIKNTIKALLETLPDLSSEKRQAILALCK